MKRVFLFCAAVVALSSSLSASTLTFSLQDDFSTARDPNGVWSYDLDGSPITAPLSGTLGTGWGQMSNWDGSIIRAANPPVPNGTLGVNDWKPRDILIHTYSFGGDDSILWTSPAAGAIDISGAAWDADFEAGRNADWELTINGKAIASCSSIYGLTRTDSSAYFANDLLPGASLDGISVKPGDVLAFTAHTMTTYGHWMGADLNVELKTVPEPSTLVLLGIAALGLLGYAWRSSLRT